MARPDKPFRVMLVFAVVLSITMSIAGLASAVSVTNPPPDLNTAQVNEDMETGYAVLTPNTFYCFWTYISSCPTPSGEGFTDGNEKYWCKHKEGMDDLEYTDPNENWYFLKNYPDWKIWKEPKCLSPSEVSW